jgi:DNA-binding MarR family transcriptional regulator
MAGKRSAAARAAETDVARAGLPRRGGQREGATIAAAPVARAANLDRVMHDRTRLAIVTALSVNPSLSFTELKGITQTTDGNLSVHARKLEDAGYVSCTKGFEGRLPKTEFSLTDAGRRAFKKYLDHMEAIIQHARGRR